MKWRRAMVWVKPDSSPQLSGDRPAQGYESIAASWCGAGRSEWNGGGKRGVFTFGKHDAGMGRGGGRNEHPTQKPVELIERIVRASSPVDGRVLDCFLGSGTTGVACMRSRRHATGIDMSAQYLAIAQARFDATEVPAP